MRGERYYGLVNTSNSSIYPIKINTLYPEQYGMSGLKTGRYTIHFQKNTPNVAREDTLDYSFDVVLGEVTVVFQDYTTGAPISSVKRGQKVLLTGNNTDGPDTYLWLTGLGLPDCGTGLFPSSLPVYSTSPTKINASIINSVNSPYHGRYYDNGTWELLWDTSSLPLAGNQSYSVYASSINPELVLPFIPPRGSCTTTEKGLCAFETCPYCGPISDPATIKLLDPSPVDVTIDPSIVSPCCCQGYPCGSSDSADKITIKMKTGVSRLPVQIWMFGESSIGERGYLFSDSYKTMLDDEGTFELDINKYLLEPNDIKLCDLEAGVYTIVVQVPYVTAVGDEIFDVTLETSSYATKIQNALFPSEQDPTRLYVVQSDPLYWTKAFAVEGPGAYSGTDALNKLKSTLSQSFVRDKAAYATFTLNPKYCPDREVVNFNADVKDGYKPLKVSFTDASSFKGTAYLWDFGDNSTSIVQNPAHVYQNSGTYSVRLTVTNVNGTELTRQKPSYIIARDIEPAYSTPVAGFTSAKVDNEPLAIQFIDQSYGSTPLSYLWSFGDQYTSTNKSPNHTYSNARTYLVNLTVTDQYAKSSTSSVNVLVQPVTPPTSAFVINSVENDTLQYQFIDKSTGAPYSWAWSFGDNTKSNLNSPNHTYALYGNYSVSLTVSNSAGINTAYSSVNIPAPEKPVVADFTYVEKTGSVGAFTFADNSTGPILKWVMSYGDGNVSTYYVSGWNETHKFFEMGNYPVKLYVTNGVNSSNSEKTVYVS